MDLLTNENDYELETILSELKSQINDSRMPQPLINKIKEMGNNNQVAKSILGVTLWVGLSSLHGSLLLSLTHYLNL